MKNRFLVLCIGFCMFVAAAQRSAFSMACDATSANLVMNCGFETGDFTSWTLSGNDVPGELGNLYGVEGTDPVDGISPNSGSYQAFFGDLDANATTLSQTINTATGGVYQVSFYLAQDTTPARGGYSNELIVDFGSKTLVSLNAMPVQGYTLYSFDVTATSNSTPFSITIGNDLGYTLLDDVQITATPEPATWSLLLLGGLALFLLRKQLAQQSIL